MANLIVCCDGTWNTPDQEDNGQPAPTNVFKLHGALAPSDAGGAPQHAYYRAGVGTSGNLMDKALGGALGVGLGQDIKSAYNWLRQTFDPDTSQIFLFGFSRGAYTVRSLAGMIGRCGLLIHDDDTPEVKRWADIDAVYELYRGPKQLAEQKIKHYTRHDDVTIHFMGVWDTVGALGIPDELPIDFIYRRKDARFHDTQLGDNVRCARHAVAIDERRLTFAPTLWSNPRPDRVKQVWFPGVHGDLGGSYAERGLGDIALQWMINEAQAEDLAFKDGALSQIKPDHQGVLHDSVRGVFAKMRTRPRAVPDIRSPAIHLTARARSDDPPLIQPEYWPTEVLVQGQSRSFDVFARDRWNTTDLYLEAGATYRFEAKGEWLDASIRCSPDGPVTSFSLGQLFQAPTWISRKLQERRREKRSNASAIVPGAPRESKAPYFCLIGVVASGIGADDKTKELMPHDTFQIGSSNTHTPDESGYLYCFANDLWSLYGNNKGCVHLTVSRQ